MDHIKSISLELFAGEERIYRSIDTLETDLGLYPAEFFNSLTPSGLPKHGLKLKIGCTVKLIRNINISTVLANGTRLTVFLIHSHSLECEIINGSHQGHIAVIPRIFYNP